jgi:hypothetical protein
MNISWRRYNNQQKFCHLRRNEISSPNNEQYYLIAALVCNSKRGKGPSGILYYFRQRNENTMNVRVVI